MELKFVGLLRPEVLGVFAFLAFALFSFITVFANGGLSRDRLGRAFRLGLRPKALLIGGLSLLAGGGFVLIMSLIGGVLARLTRSSVPAVIFSVIGAAGILYVMFASAYILNYMAITDLRDGKRIGFAEAAKAFFAKQGQVILLPLIVGGILLVEMGLFLVLGLDRGSDALFFLSCFFTLPILPINLILFLLLILGGGIFLPVMIDQQKGALGTFKGIATAVKQRFLRLLSVQVVVIVFLGVIVLVMYLVFTLASSFGVVEHGQTPVMAAVQALLSGSVNVFDFGGGALVSISYFLIVLLVSAVALVAAAIIWNMNMCLYSVFYLDYIKDSVDFDEPLIARKK